MYGYPFHGDHRRTGDRPPPHPWGGVPPPVRAYPPIYPRPPSSHDHHGRQDSLNDDDDDDDSQQGEDSDDSIQDAEEVLDGEDDDDAEEVVAFEESSSAADLLDPTVTSSPAERGQEPSSEQEQDDGSPDNTRVSAGHHSDTARTVRQNLFTKPEQDATEDRKRPRPSAFAFLQGLVKEGSNEMSQPAQSILKNLLAEEAIHLAEPTMDVECSLQAASAWLQSKRVVDKSMTDEEILELAKKNELSYLGSFLKCLEEDEEMAVTARSMCRRCCLAVDPAKVPAGMDAEEFALAALEFLEKKVDTSGHPHLPQFPLIRAVKEENDIRRRAYVKAYDWRLSDILDRAVYLDNILLSDASDLTWLRREAFAPMSMDSESEEALFMKGRFRASAAKKKTPVPRKKAKPQAADKDPDSGKQESSVAVAQPSKTEEHVADQVSGDIAE